jgi:predicted ester cyclase
VGADGIRALFEAIGPITQQWTIEDFVAEGDKVVIRTINTCEQDSFLGIPAKGHRQTFSAMFMHQIVDGRIVRTWRNVVDLGRVMQLGAKLTPGEAR